MYDIKAESVDELKARAKRTFARMEQLNETMNSRRLTEGERDELDHLSREHKAIHDTIEVRKRQDARTAEDGRTQGTPNEALGSGQTFRTWFTRAQANGVKLTTDEGRQVSLSDEGRDHDLNRYWAERMGLVRPSIESRALAEDTPGSGQAITPQSWVADYVDVLLPLTIMGKTGSVRVPMSTEIVTVPVFTSTVAPAWLAEGSNIALDGNPAFAPLTLSAQGGWKDITLFSRELAQDAYIRGGLANMLTQAVANKMAVAVDTAMFLSQGYTGAPGLVGETGLVFRHVTGDAGTSGKALTDTTEFSVMAELIRNKHAEPSAVMTNPSIYGTVNRLNASTYANFWEMPSDVAQVTWVYSANSALPTTETDPATASSVAQTGGNCSSIWMGPWNQYCVLGTRMDVETQVLTERYAHQGQIGLFSMMRFSLRYAHPETFVRTIGVLTT